jgi:hypothetical protein
MTASLSVVEDFRRRGFQDLPSRRIIHDGRAVWTTIVAEFENDQQRIEYLREKIRHFPKSPLRG